MISIYQQYGYLETTHEYLNILKPNTKPYTYETGSYFGASEGKFKAWYNNHKELFTLY